MINKFNKKIFKICIISMLSAIFYVVGKFLVLYIGMDLKLTFKVFLLYVISVTFSPISGMIVGGIGEFLIQLTSEYGLTITTILWVLPYVILSFLFGIIYKNLIKNNSRIKLFLLFFLSNIMLSILNTIVFYIDAKLFGYYSFILIFGKFFVKIFMDIVLAIIYTILFPYCVSIVKKVIKTIN